jgi:hypothetical protein
VAYATSNADSLAAAVITYLHGRGGAGERQRRLRAASRSRPVKVISS